MGLMEMLSDNWSCRFCLFCVEGNFRCCLVHFLHTCVSPVENKSEGRRNVACYYKRLRFFITLQGSSPSPSSWPALNSPTAPIRHCGIKIWPVQSATAVERKRALFTLVPILSATVGDGCRDSAPRIVQNQVLRLPKTALTRHCGIKKWHCPTHCSDGKERELCGSLPLLPLLDMGVGTAHPGQYTSPTAAHTVRRAL